MHAHTERSIESTLAARPYWHAHPRRSGSDQTPNRYKLLLGLGH